MEEFEHIHPVLHAHEGRGVPFVKLRVRLFEGGEQFVLVVFVQVFMKNERGAFGIVHPEHRLHLLAAHGGEAFGNEQTAVRGDALDDRLRARDTLFPSRTDKLHSHSFAAPRQPFNSNRPF